MYLFIGTFVLCIATVVNIPIVIALNLPRILQDYFLTDRYSSPHVWQAHSDWSSFTYLSLTWARGRFVTSLTSFAASSLIDSFTFYQQLQAAGKERPQPIKTSMTSLPEQSTNPGRVWAFAGSSTQSQQTLITRWNRNSTSKRPQRLCRKLFVVSRLLAYCSEKPKRKRRHGWHSFLKKKN